jgi:membrane protease YdiL (CAAX protease family)
VFYFLFAYGISWVVWIPYLLSRDGFGLMSFRSPIDHSTTAYIFSFGPAVSAFLMMGVLYGWSGIRQLLQKMVLWRVALWWYLFVFIGIPVIELLGTIVVPGNLAPVIPLAPLPALLAYIPFFIYPALIIGGPLGEEPGWRGFALPRLQERRGPLVGTLILAPLWALWHWPAIWATAWPQNHFSFFPNLVLYVLFLTAWSVLMTWLFNNTRGSVLLAILAHASVDAFPNAILSPLLPATTVLLASGIYRGYFGLVVGLGVAALLVIAFTRGRLSYERYQRDISPNAAMTSN